MTRGYVIPEIRRQLISILRDSDTGMSGVELSKKLNISRTTITKYLNMFATDGTLQQRDIGNVILWSLKSKQESFTFPDDYFKVSEEYIQCINDASEERALALIQNCTKSGAIPVRIILDVIIPAYNTISQMYTAGKIGAAEQNLLYSIVSRSIFALNNSIQQTNSKKKNVIVIAADKHNEPISHAVSAAYRSKKWSVFELGDMSATAGVLFDLDFEKLVDRIWNTKQGILITIVFSSTRESLNFFADSLYPIVKKTKRMYLLLCGRGLEESLSNLKSCDYFVSDDISKVLQWSDTTYSSYLSL